MLVQIIQKLVKFVFWFFYRIGKSFFTEFVFTELSHSPKFAPKKTKITVEKNDCLVGGGALESGLLWGCGVWCVGDAVSHQGGI